MKIKAIGLSTNIDNRAKNWTKGMELANIPHKLLGVGQKFTSVGMKSWIFLKELQEDTTTDIFIISDVYDVLVNQKVVNQIRDAGETVDGHIISTFYSFGKPIVVGAEIPCYGNCHKFSFSSVLNVFRGKYIYLNSGLMIGYRPHLIQLCKHLGDYKDDQLGVGRFMDKYPNMFALDLDSKLFYNFFVTNDKKRSDSALFVHFPGLGLSVAGRKGYNSLDSSNYSPIPPKTRLFQLLKFCIFFVYIALLLIIISIYY